MAKICRILLISLLLVGMNISLRAYSADYITYKEDYECAHKLQDALKKNDKTAVAHLIAYPFEREKPLPPIKTEEDFLKSWDDFFNVDTISELLNAEPGEIGWRGVQLGGGGIWFQRGKIYRINMQTAAFREKLDKAKKAEYAMLHPSARDYKRIRYECDTASHHIRIQEHKDGMHYFSWKKGEALSQKPELALKGSLEYQGTGGGELYTFENKEYSYKINKIGSVCGEDCNNYLTVSKNGEELSKQVCE